MSLIACPSFDTLCDFMLGELPESELSEVARHLDACSRCDNQAGQLDQADDAMLLGLKLVGNPKLARLMADQQYEAADQIPPVPGLGESRDDFRIIREIDRAGMGVVCEAYQGSLNRHVAIKMLSDRGNRARF